MADGDGEGGDSLGGGHVPSGELYPSVPHYYGDIVRQLMLGAAALMLFGAPFYGDSLRAELPFEVIGTLVLVSLAAITNPWQKSVLIADAVAVGIGLGVYQTWALSGYGTVDPITFVLRETIAVIFLFAFYFSLKTVRAMILHQIGKRESVDEFDDATVRRKNRQSKWMKKADD